MEQDIYTPLLFCLRCNGSLPKDMESGPCLVPKTLVEFHYDQLLLYIEIFLSDWCNLECKHNIHMQAAILQQYLWVHNGVQGRINGHMGSHFVACICILYKLECHPRALLSRVSWILEAQKFVFLIVRDLLRDCVKESKYLDWAALHCRDFALKKEVSKTFDYDSYECVELTFEHGN